MTIRLTLQHALRNFLVFRRHREAPWWARLLVGTALVLAVALLMMALSVFLMGQNDPRWWRSSLSNNLLLGICSACAMLLMLRAAEWLLPPAWLDWHPVALTSMILLAGAALGMRGGYVLLGLIHDYDMWAKLGKAPMVQLKLALFIGLILAANWVWTMLRAKERALAQQAAESQLRMLQAQIEPHFLFNTLANVQSLISTDPARAELMLETFTDYLRASLGQMRTGDSTLAAELDTAQNYLSLMQIRMGKRLSFSIEASSEARMALLPPLLLQPLVENAVHHGIGPKLAGGKVVLRASVHEGRLDIAVEDDGMGLVKAPAPAGHGLALHNIRSRLETRFGKRADLALAPLAQGTRATMSLPFQRADSAAAAC